MYSCKDALQNKGLVAAQKLDSSYILEIIGKNSGKVSPIDCKNEIYVKAVDWSNTQSNKCPELTGNF